MADNVIFILTSRDSGAPRTLLLGLAYHGDCIINGTAGLKCFLRDKPDFDVRELREGRFLLVRESAGKTTVKTDDLAQNSIFMYRAQDASGYWAISNSLLTLVDKLKEDGIAVGFHRAGVLSFFVGNQSMWGGQPLSLNTLIEGVTIVPAGCHLEITRQHSQSPSLNLIGPPAAQDIPSDEYADRLLHYVRQTRARIEALASCGVEFNVGLSGGMDSRFNLGLINAMRSDSLPIRVRSDASKKQDLPVAQELAAHYGIELKGFVDRGWGEQSDPYDAYALWQQAYLGVYLPAQTPHGLASERSRFTLHGGNFKDRSYRRQSVKKRARTIARNFASRDDGELVAGEFLDFFRERDVDPNSPLAMDRHYVDTRSRFHTGVHWFSEYSTPLMTPHLSGELFSLYQSLEIPAQNGEQLLHDLLYILDPDLVNIPFDTPDKYFSHEIRKSCPFSGEVDPVGDISEPKIYGSFDQPEKPSNHKSVREAVSQHFREDAEAFLPELSRFDSSGALVAEAKRGLEEGGRIRNMRLASLAVTLGVFAQRAPEDLPTPSTDGLD
ncbi:hypothetical protein ACS8E6_13525 [Salinicola halophyticus]|uniref:hypothetical protein n=1 Tax=Salinicola halophyticus TaxID=1808881 RepID=UPI003F469A6F